MAERPLKLAVYKLVNIELLQLELRTDMNVDIDFLS